MPSTAPLPATRHTSGTSAMTPLPSTLGELGELCGGEVDELGVLLWLTARRIEAGLESRRRRLGSTCASLHPACVHEERALSYELALDFEEYAGCGEAVARDLALLASPRDYDDAPAQDDLASACRRLAEWCEGTARLGFAVRFADAAAELDPTEPVHANLAGRLNREAGHWLRAHAHFRRGVAAARAKNDRMAYVRGYLGWGNLWAELGEHAEATKLYQRAAWHAQRSGRRALAAEVHHDMLVMATAAGEYEDAARFAERAINVYPVHHERIPALAYDFALLLVRQRMHRGALPLLEEAAGKFRLPNLCVLATSALARAAAGAGQMAAYVDARERALGEIARFGLTAPAPFVNLAHAARCARDWPRTEEYAARAHGLAAARGYAEEERLAAMLLRWSSARVEEEAPVEMPRWRPGMEFEPLLPLVHLRLSSILARWRGPTWRRKQQAGQEQRGKV
jgi:tetratricopeptide (TPR) repeat protein